MPFVLLLLLRQRVAWPPAWLLATAGWLVLMLELVIALRDVGA